MPAILVVEDHDAVRNGLVAILQEAFVDAVFGEARNAHEALALSDQASWDIVVLDVALPDRGGLSLLEEFHRGRPERPVLVVSLWAETIYASFSLGIGAKGYVTKQGVPAELVDAVNTVLSGGTYVSSILAGEPVPMGQECSAGIRPL